MVPGHRGLRRACTNSQEVALRQMSGRDKTLIDRVDCWVGVLVIVKSGLLFVPAGPPQGREGQLPASHPQARREYPAQGADKITPKLCPQVPLGKKGVCEEIFVVKESFGCRKKFGVRKVVRRKFLLMTKLLISEEEKKHTHTQQTS